MKHVIALVMCLALPAAAQSNEVKKFLNAAITLYENLEYEKALKQLNKAKLKAQGSDDEARIGLLEGIVLADMGREEKALTAFKTAFGIELEAKLPVDVSPKVQAVAEKARANVRKLLAPTLEAQRAEEARRVADEAQRAEATARAAADEKRRLDEDRARTTPPPVVVKAAPNDSKLRLWSIVPAVLGLGGAAVGTAFLVLASGKYSALKTGTIDLATAQRYRQSGPTDATIGYIGVGVGVVGLAAAATLFALGGSATAAPQVSVVPLRGGAFMAVSFELGAVR